MNGIIGFDGTLEGSVNAGGGGGTVPEIYADATVDNNTGTPAVTVTRTEIPGVSDTFHFAFQNLKGETGSAGSQGIQGIQGIPGPEGPQGPRGFTGQTGSAGPAGSDGYSPVVTIAAITGGNRVTITDETHPLGQSFDVMNGIDGSDGQTGPQGPQGNPGQGVPTGGTDGQILAKNGSSDYQTRWIDPIPDALPIISDEYDEHTAYSVGNYCINENTLYKCNTDINPYEVWDPSHWDACTVGEEIAAANSEIDTINASLTQLEGQISTAKFGIDSGNKTSFSFTNLHNLNNTSIYKHGIVVIGAGSTQCTVYMVWINESNTNVVFTNLTSTTVRNLTGSVSGTTLTITADSTVYGGLKLIWLT